MACFGVGAEDRVPPLRPAARRREREPQGQAESERCEGEHRRAARTLETHRGLTYKNKGVQKWSNEHKQRISLALKNKYENGYKQSKESIDRGHKKLLKPIIQLDLDNVIIREWPSIKDAAETLKLNRGNIGSCLYGKRNHAGQFKWKFKNE